LTKKSKQRSLDGLWNFMSLITLLILFGVISILVTLYLNPYADFNPFPPIDLPEAIVLPTPTEIPVNLPDLSTEIPEEETENTPIVLPTATAEIVFQEGTPVAEETPMAPTETPFVGYYSFKIQNEANAINGEIFKPDLGCGWAGVAGQVFDLQGRPVKGIRVWLRGSLNGYQVDMLGLTLDSSPYGPSGFEFTLADSPVASSGKLYVQLLDQAGIPISDKVYFDTYADCEKNLILINFKQVR